MSWLPIDDGDDRMEPFGLEVPNFVIENDVEPPTFDDSKVYQYDEALISHPETVENFLLHDV